MIRVLLVVIIMSDIDFGTLSNFHDRCVDTKEIDWK